MSSPAAAPAAGVVVGRSVATARTAVVVAAARATGGSGGAQREFGIESPAARIPVATSLVVRASAARFPAPAAAPPPPVPSTSAGQAQREFGVQ